MQLVNIPEERVGVLVGEKGKDKRKLEKLCRCKLKVSEEGEVEVKAKDPLDEWRAKDVVLAIGRGFAPERALKLTDEDYYLKIMDLRILFDSDNELARVKGRVIGEQGRTRLIIEQCSDADVCVYGHTVAIIGLVDEVALAEQAIGMLIEGAMHSTVYKFLERGRRRLNDERRKLWVEHPERKEGA
ncbi:MAG: KH domain-containing protein [Candidatus Burarchaeum sp.]|nr:KH domain-containing protein [Candidatus Burarchaeum sp.]MDO8339528.1 KH domain-containing protein [Candidatus Burarchaeum sp.]